MRTRGQRAVGWMEKYCLYPRVPHAGQLVRLTQVQRELLLRLYDRPEQQPQEPLRGPLAAYVALLHICGPEAVGQQDARPPVEVDVWTLWGATSPDLKAVLRRYGDSIVCRELGTRFPPVAA